jgi:prepilin-type N-terminal cleavage/methylation domain-containing protein
MNAKVFTIKNRSLSAKSGQKGYTLVELSISLAIISVILVGALTGVQRLIQNNNANNTLTSAQTAMANAMKVAAVSNDQNIYEDTLGLGRLAAWDPAFVLRNAAGAVTNIRNPFGGFVHTQRNGVGVGTTPAGAGIWYTITGVPNGACFTTASAFNNNSIAIAVSRPVVAANIKANYAFNLTPHTQASGGGIANPAYVAGGANPQTAMAQGAAVAALAAANAAKIDGGLLSVNNLETSCSDGTNQTKDIHVLVAAN